MCPERSIQDELKQLNSRLAEVERKKGYSVPENYFDSLADHILLRIKAQHSENPSEEIQFLSPLLSRVSKEMPYSIPENYFTSLYRDILHATTNYDSVQEETEKISGLVAGINKTNVYSAPQGYFEQNADVIVTKADSKPAKIISMYSRRKFRFGTVAAMMAGIILFSSIILLKKQGIEENGKQVLAKISNDIKKMNDEQQQALIEFLNAGLSGKETATSTKDGWKQEIQLMLQDIPEEELIHFKQQTDDMENLLMVN
ncbi:MAG: hypothetical protein N2747_08880 [Chitinophagaceae bacterium]|nr:hypothetical protein [Chitinophagaceae bacterium]